MTDQQNVVNIVTENIGGNTEPLIKTMNIEDINNALNIINSQRSLLRVNVPDNQITIQPIVQQQVQQPVQPIVQQPVQQPVQPIVQPTVQLPVQQIVQPTVQQLVQQPVNQPPTDPPSVQHTNGLQDGGLVNTNTSDYYTLFGYSLSKTTIYIIVGFVVILVGYYLYQKFYPKPVTEKKKRKQEVSFNSQNKDADKNTEGED